VVHEVILLHLFHSVYVYILQRPAKKQKRRRHHDYCPTVIEISSTDDENCAKDPPPKRRKQDKKPAPTQPSAAPSPSTQEVKVKKSATAKRRKCRPLVFEGVSTDDEAPKHKKHDKKPALTQPSPAPSKQEVKCHPLALDDEDCATGDDVPLLVLKRRKHDKKPAPTQPAQDKKPSSPSHAPTQPAQHKRSSSPSRRPLLSPAEIDELIDPIDGEGWEETSPTLAVLNPADLQEILMDLPYSPMPGDLIRPQETIQAASDLVRILAEVRTCTAASL
jgi:hypothetical protein